VEPARRRAVVWQVPPRPQGAGRVPPADRLEGPPVYDQEKLYDTVEAPIAIGDDHGVSAAQVALAYMLGRPAVTSVIIGARTTEQLTDILGAADLVLTTEERQRLDAVSALPLLNPYWHQAKTARDRLSSADLTLLGPHL